MTSDYIQELLKYQTSYLVQDHRLHWKMLRTKFETLVKILHTLYQHISNCGNPAILQSRINHVQSNLFITDTKGTEISVRIIEVSVLEK